MTLNQLGLFDNVDCGAEFSVCRRYRYQLWRQWRDDGHTICFIMLNPSTATDILNDPTVERCQRRASMLGAGRLVVVNIFAWRATDPQDMLTAADPVGPLNNQAILEEALAADQVILAWGNHGKHLGRGDVRVLLKEANVHPMVLQMTQEGEPQHPLYLSYKLKPTLLP